MPAFQFYCWTVLAKHQSHLFFIPPLGEQPEGGWEAGRGHSGDSWPDHMKEIFHYNLITPCSAVNGGGKGRRQVPFFRLFAVQRLPGHQSVSRSRWVTAITLLGGLFPSLIKSTSQHQEFFLFCPSHSLPIPLGKPKSVTGLAARWGQATTFGYVQERISFTILETWTKLSLL